MVSDEMKALPDDPRSLRFGAYVENDEGVWQVVGHRETDGLPIIRKRDRDEVPEYQTEVDDGE